MLGSRLNCIRILLPVGADSRSAQEHTTTHMHISEIENGRTNQDTTEQYFVGRSRQPRAEPCSEPKGDRDQR